MTVATVKSTTCWTPPTTVIACLLLVTACGWPATELAAAKQDNKAATRVEDTDDDFALQGEYTGYLSCGDGMQRATGLQIAAQGDGQFRGVEYPGGLPGSGWNRRYKYEFEGQSQDGKLFVVSPNYAYTIDGRTVEVASIDGQGAGRMMKTKRMSRTLGAPPPYNAMVLFDGTHVDHFKQGKITEDRHLQMGTELKQAYGAYHLHLEFRLPYMPNSRGQGRANSGVYLQSRYEVQVLDSFALHGEFNECGAIYRYVPPRLNMCLPPLSWQTYDIFFQAPRFDKEKQKVANARITVLHNGVAVHEDFPLERKTGAGKPEGANPLPIKFQDHGNPVVYRNIWLVDYTDQRKHNAASVGDGLMYANLGIARPYHATMRGSMVASSQSSTARFVDSDGSIKSARSAARRMWKRVRPWSQFPRQARFGFRRMRP